MNPHCLSNDASREDEGVSKRELVTGQRAPLQFSSLVLVADYQVLQIWIRSVRLCVSEIALVLWLPDANLNSALLGLNKIPTPRSEAAAPSLLQIQRCDYQPKSFSCDARTAQIEMLLIEWPGRCIDPKNGDRSDLRLWLAKMSICVACCMPRRSPGSE